MFWIDQNYYIFEVFVGLKSEITNILVTKNVIYVKLPDIQQLLEEYPLPCLSHSNFFWDDRPYWCHFSNEKCRLRKTTRYSTAVGGIPPACPTLIFFWDDRPYWCLSTCNISWSLLLLFSHYERFKVFKLNFLDVLPVRALSNVKKSHLKFKSFPMTPVSWL